LKDVALDLIYLRAALEYDCGATAVEPENACKKKQSEANI
jgi:hypothetical protein